MPNCANHEFHLMNNGYMPLRDKSVTLMRFYGFPHHGDRFFAGALNDALPVFLTTGTDPSHSFRMTFYGLLHHDSEPSSSLRVIPDRPPSEEAAGARSAIEDTRLS